MIGLLIPTLIANVPKLELKNTNMRGIKSCSAAVAVSNNDGYVLGEGEEAVPTRYTNEDV